MPAPELKEEILHLIPPLHTKKEAKPNSLESNMSNPKPINPEAIWGFCTWVFNGVSGSKSDESVSDGEKDDDNDDEEADNDEENKKGEEGSSCSSFSCEGK